MAAVPIGTAAMPAVPVGGIIIVGGILIVVGGVILTGGGIVGMPLDEGGVVIGTVTGLLTIPFGAPPGPFGIGAAVHWHGV
jgi:hypothetical protein